MTITYLVAIDIPIADPQTILDTAEDMQTDLLSAGHEVLSVHAWARPNLPGASPAGGFASLALNPNGPKSVPTPNPTL